MTSYALHQPLLQHWLPSSNYLLKAALVVAGTVLLAVSAKIQVPFWPVPMTMQTFAVLVVAMAFGWRLGSLTVATYLVEGAVGLPVFASGTGVAYMMGPTGGYLLGFLLAAVVVGKMADWGWDRSVVRTLLAMTLGTGVIFFCGVSWLTTLIGFEQALSAGLWPFIPGALAKIALAAALLPGIWRLMDQQR